MRKVGCLWLNVKDGDCSLIEHNSGHTSVIDVCSANHVEPLQEALVAHMVKAERGISGSFRQEVPTQAGIQASANQHVPLSRVQAHLHSWSHVRSHTTVWARA